MLVRLIFTSTLLNTANEFKDCLNFEHGFDSDVADLEVSEVSEASEALAVAALVPGALVPAAVPELAACQVGYGVSNSRAQN